MTSKIDILKKYYMDAEQPKKKIRKKITSKPKVKIFEANVDINDVRAGTDSENERNDIEEETPQVAQVIDDRPLEMRSFKKSFNNVSEDDSTYKKSGRRKRQDSSDESPPRKSAPNDTSDDQALRRRRRRDSSSDESPPRRPTDSKGAKSRRAASDSDASPPRRVKVEKPDSDIDSPPRRRRRQERGDREIVACEVVEGPETIKLRGGKREAEAAAKKEQADKEARRKAIYDKWSAGIIQQQQREAHIDDIVHEANKPLARAADDADLEDRLRAVERAEDPMLAFIKKKKQNSQPDRPRYNGNQPPPNRYNLWPGYRWDGVDRSNGFESKMMAMKNDKIANEEEAYKWSVEDM